MIDKKLVQHIADLARLSLSDEETEEFAHQLASILGYVEQLNKVDTSNVEPTALVAPAHDPLRQDEPTPSLPPDKLLQNGPKVKNGYFAVPKVINQ
jgi:aspartyl-tRNA(Asn)/glutamyl-tRNA(Gln) amidotransferase subunit C